MSDNNQTYEECMQQLKQIIEDFQKGNMQLSQAVEKYNICSVLIEKCNKMLSDACIIEVEEEKTKLEDVKFEENMKSLEEMMNRLSNSKDITLDELTQIYKSSKQKSQQCEMVLNNFQNMIEYTKQ